jgi:histidinol-phosphate/aromatic aminotransferase/cobyric acid decarboxylase-like protein
MGRGQNDYSEQAAIHAIEESSYHKTQNDLLRAERKQMMAALHDSILVMKTAPCFCSGTFVCTRCQALRLADEAIKGFPDRFKSLARFNRPGLNSDV